MVNSPPYPRDVVGISVRDGLEVDRDGRSRLAGLKQLSFSSIESQESGPLEINSSYLQRIGRSDNLPSPLEASFESPIDLKTNPDNILKFPIESTHAYSYAQLSPNSLALRLNVLKRSLEILKDRPSLIKPLDEDLGLKKTKSNIFNLYNNSNDNLPLLGNSNLNRSGIKSSNGYRIPSSSYDTELQEIIKLLDTDNLEIASTLHDLSLTSDKVIKHDLLKNKLLYALSTPFIENSFELASKNLAQSSIALNLLNQPQFFNPTFQPNQSYHSSSSKRSVPQSVFTVSLDNPWNVIAANDLACLMFGVWKESIKNLSLMDLIAPQFRDFVTTRLTRICYTDHSIQKNSHNIIFAGEIVAISRPGDQTSVYTSLWAKKKGSLIICMFDQIPCDAIDVIISSPQNVESAPSYKTASVNYTAGSLDFNLNTNDDLDKLSTKLKDELLNNYEKSTNSSLGRDLIDSNFINLVRYYTLQHDNENIPCAITTNTLEMHPENYEIKLKIHTLPYIAGMFILDANNFTILSCNNAIAKNMFGKAMQDITNQSIDILIPRFSEIVKYGLSDIPGLKFAPGLVLPEHFFRKYDSVLKCKEEGLTNIEEYFFLSKGITGIHRDGNSILVDAQLRDSGNGTLVVWITYSRSPSHWSSKDLDTLPSSTSLISISLEKSNKSADLKLESPDTTVNPDVFANLSYSVSPKPASERRSLRRTNTVNHTLDLPSQMKLTPTDLPFAPSSNEIGRSSSTRKSKASTFGIPISILNKSLGESISFEAENRINFDKKIRSISNNSIFTTHDMDSQSGKKSDSSETLYSTYSEEEMLKLEDEILQHKMDRSPHWPREVGLKRRTKKFTEFKVLKTLGEGAYGKVLLAVHQEDPEYNVVIKCIDKERILVDTWVRDRKLGTIPSEIQIMANLNAEPHPNIMRIVDFFEDRKCYYLETPIFGSPPGIDLFDYIEVKPDMSESECKLIFRQICAAVYHLHKHGIVHRDIKDENIIVDENGIIKLTDFGSAGYTNQGPFDVFVGTIDYASPEVLRGEKYEGKPQDIWALGILLYTMLYKENPFYNVDEIMEGDLKLPCIISSASLDLIMKILVRDLNNRPTITDIVEHPWLHDP